MSRFDCICFICSGMAAECEWDPWIKDRAEHPETEDPHSEDADHSGSGVRTGVAATLLHTHAYLLWRQEIII